MTEQKKVVKKPSKTDESISYILETLKSIETRLSVLESDSHEPMDFVDDVDALETRLNKVEGRMGLQWEKIMQIYLDTMNVIRMLSQVNIIY